MFTQDRMLGTAQPTILLARQQMKFSPKHSTMPSLITPVWIMNAFILIAMFINGLMHTEIHTVRLGDTPVEIIRQVGQGKTFVHLHESETTALMAAKYYVDKEGGTVITLHHHGTRNIRFSLHNIDYQFDPNRIFTDTGIKKTLKDLGPYSIEAHHQVKLFANEIKKLLPKDKVIAVHNNKGYSIKEYFPHHAMAKDAKTYHYLPQSNFRNFYFVTQNHEYSRLKILNFNVALQAKHAHDDGSLSYYLSRKNYINIEAGYGQLSAQVNMLYHA